MYKTKRHPRRAGRSRLRSILLIGGAAVLAAIVIGLRRRSSKTVPTQARLISETEMREHLSKDLPVTERRLDLAEVSTSLLEGGEGPPIVLLHGQGGFAAMWGRVIPHLVGSHRVVAPDLPGLGHSEVRAGNLDARAMVAWLGELIEQTCAEPPVLVGHSLGDLLLPTSRSSAATSSRGSSWSILERSLLSGRRLARWPRSCGTSGARAQPTTSGSLARCSSIPTAFGLKEVSAGRRSKRTTSTERPNRACVSPTVSCCGGSACGGSHPISSGRSMCPLRSSGAGTIG
jgi:hypothetical protein